MAGLQQSSLSLLLAGLLFSQAHAADINGYTAEYECRAGGTQCNVDVASYTTADCDQIITTSTSPTNNWSAINWSNDVICIQKGDHTGRGDLDMGSSGSSGNYKVIRYYDPADTDLDPWDLSSANQARIQGINPNDRDYWIIHRISFTENRNSNTVNFPSDSTADHWIFNRVLGGGIGGAGDEGVLYIRGADDITVQNSVLRNCQIQTGRSYRLLHFSDATNLRIVNNEIYNCAKGISTPVSNAPCTNCAIENNDVYIEPSFGYTDCSGNFTPSGTCSIVKILVSIGSPQPSATPLIVTQNRIWGARRCDTTVSCSGGGAGGYGIDGGYDAGGSYTLFQNNIIMDCTGGIGRGAGDPGTLQENVSIIGNIIFDTKQFSGNGSLSGISFWRDNGTARENEIYLNTLIGSVGSSDAINVTGDTADIKCNTLISSGTIDSGSSFVVDYNAFYDGTLYQTGSNSINPSITTRQNSQGLLEGVIVRTAGFENCSTVFDDSCYLYKVTTAGTTAASKPTYCTSANCTTTDGTAVLTSIRGPYQFYRKLQTTPELTVIPYARIYSGAPDATLCPSTFMSTNNRGIDDSEFQ